MLEYIQNNISLILAILSIVSILLNILILLIKKVPLKKIIKVMSLVPSLITDSERMFLLSDTGDRKKEVVRDLFYKLCDDYGISKYAKFINIDDLIEEILLTPTKKKGE